MVPIYNKSIMSKANEDRILKVRFHLEDENKFDKRRPVINTLRPMLYMHLICIQTVICELFFFSF